MKVYIHYAEMDTMLIHVTKGDPIFSPDKTLDATSDLAVEFANVPNREVLLTISEGMDLVNLCCSIEALGSCNISTGAQFK